MNSLAQFFQKEDLVYLATLNPHLFNLTDEEVDKAIANLESLGCEREEVKEIIYENPFYLEITEEDFKELINSLSRLNLLDYGELFISNPHLLRVAPTDLAYSINEFKSIGLDEDAIIDKLQNGEY